MWRYSCRGAHVGVLMSGCSPGRSAGPLPGANIRSWRTKIAKPPGQGKHLFVAVPTGWFDCIAMTLMVNADMNDIDETLTALADPIRRHVVELLQRGPARASSIAELAGMSPAAMSRAPQGAAPERPGRRRVSRRIRQQQDAGCFSCRRKGSLRSRPGWSRSRPSGPEQLDSFEEGAFERQEQQHDEPHRPHRGCRTVVTLRAGDRLRRVRPRRSDRGSASRRRGRAPARSTADIVRTQASAGGCLPPGRATRMGSVYRDGDGLRSRGCASLSTAPMARRWRCASKESPAAHVSRSSTGASTGSPPQTATWRSGTGRV